MQRNPRCVVDSVRWRAGCERRFPSPRCRTRVRSLAVFALLVADVKQCEAPVGKPEADRTRARRNLRIAGGDCEPSGGKTQLASPQTSAGTTGSSTPVGVDSYVGARMSSPEVPLDQPGHTSRKNRTVQLAAVVAHVGL
jgi:hypothetical protein